MKPPGDPTPRSASDVLADRDYKMAVSEQTTQLGGQLTNTLNTTIRQQAVPIAAVAETLTRLVP